MAQNFENIKSKTICPDCGGKEMVLGYTYNDGSLHKQTTIFGMKGYQKVSDMVIVVCKNCGLLVKSYATDPGKL